MREDRLDPLRQVLGSRLFWAVTALAGLGVVWAFGAGCTDQAFERDHIEAGMRRADDRAGFFKEQAGGKWTASAVRNLSASLTDGDFLPQQTLAELGVLTGGTSYRIAQVRASLEAVAQRMEREEVPVSVSYSVNCGEWFQLADTTALRKARYLRLVPAPAPSGEPLVVHVKAVGLDTLQYALSLLHKWSKAFEDTHDTHGETERLKAKTDSLLNNPVIREREVIR